METIPAPKKRRYTKGPKWIAAHPPRPPRPHPHLPFDAPTRKRRLRSNCADVAALQAEVKHAHELLRAQTARASSAEKKAARLETEVAKLNAALAEARRGDPLAESIRNLTTGICGRLAALAAPVSRFYERKAPGLAEPLPDDGPLPDAIPCNRNIVPFPGKLWTGKSLPDGGPALPSAGVWSSMNAALAKGARS